MTPFTRPELQEARRAIASLLYKCEKVQPKLSASSSQATLLRRRIEALRISLSLIDRALAQAEDSDGR